MRSRQLLFLVALAILGFGLFSLLPVSPGHGPDVSSEAARPPVKAPPSVPTPPQSPPPSWPHAESPPSRPHAAESKQKPAPAGAHPILQLIKENERELEETRSRQSRTLAAAVAEYRRRYGIPPPPNFDRWFAFAQSRGVQLMDEFDTIHGLMTPFWGLKPATTRARAREALGFGNNLLGFQIRGGQISHVAGDGQWLQEALQGMLERFVEHLPDMDLAFNMNDEPRVVVPHEDMDRLLRTAREVNMPAAGAARAPRNAFSANGLGGEGSPRFDETKLTRFNVFAHQATWTHSRMSCPPGSPARALEEEDRRDDTEQYLLGDLGFVHNETAMADICLSPSLSETYGFFERPNAYSVVHDLFPIFSQSKMSSYADILYPSPWYWSDKAPYDEAKDRAWADKADALYWRGSTTGGFSRNGGWRRQHRQRLVQKINAADQARVLVNRGDEVSPRWEPAEVPRGDYRSIMDVFFSHVGQCDPGDCEAQHEFFTVKDYTDREEAWQYRHLLDMDGNAFSGRFYAFLKSRSMVYKWALSREWHQEWLRPWVHYVPLSIQGDEWLEAVRFFADGESGSAEASRMAVVSRDWAGKVLRNADLEVWFFRLLLEYGRVIDDDRETIGFSIGSQKTS